MKKSLLILSIFAMTCFAAHAQFKVRFNVILGKTAPNPAEVTAMHQEEAAHPNIADAMHNIQAAIDHLQAAPDNFGGHKGEALASLQNAYIALRKALYYRLYSDTH